MSNSLDGNMVALARYEREIDSYVEYEQLQTEIEDAILDAEDEPVTERSIAWLCGSEEFAEMVAKIKAHREATNRGTAYDFDSESIFWEHVHGVCNDDR